MNNELINQLAIWQIALPLCVIVINALVPFARHCRRMSASDSDTGAARLYDHFGQFPSICS